MNEHFLSYLRVIILIILIPVASCKSFYSGKSKTYDKIKFEKSACLNNCKAYFIEIDQKGNARLREPGKQERILDFQLTKKEFRILKKLLAPGKLSSLKDEYDFGDEDTQQKFLTLHSDNKIRVIRFGRNIPDPLKEIEAQFDLIVNTRKTVK